MQFWVVKNFCDGGIYLGNPARQVTTQIIETKEAED